MWKEFNSRSRNKINTFGFRKTVIGDPNDFFHCGLHKYARLFSIRGEIGIWQCPECGKRYTEAELMKKTKLQSKRSKAHKTVVGSLKTPKQHYDKVGNLINPKDKDAMRDLAEGKEIIEYKEYLK